jgi:hypothetical protein
MNIQNDYLQLIKQANAIFQQQYPGSVLFSAIGSPVSGVAKRADDLTDWTFKAQTRAGKTAQLDYANGQFGTASIIGVWIGLAAIPLPQGTIPLPIAISILNMNGFAQGFGNVGMGTAATEGAQPMFWFCVNQQTQGVSASTGAFFGNLFPCTAGGTLGSLQP